jgi:hypothetical protein
MRVLQCIEWLRDRIMDANLGAEIIEMVKISFVCFFIKKDTAPNLFFFCIVVILMQDTYLDHHGS